MRRWLRSLAPYLASAACLTALADAVRPGWGSEPSRKMVIVIAVDGVRWQEVFLGCEARRHPQGRNCSAVDLMPNLRRLAFAEGAVFGSPGGALFSVRGPSYVSLPGYQQLFSGRPELPCESNECGRIQVHTVAESVATRFGKSQAAVFSSWSGVAEAAEASPGSVQLSVGRDGAGSAYRPDPETAARALDYATERAPRFLFVGLGDTDEAAHRDNYLAYLDALAEADRWIGRFWYLAQQRDALGHSTTLFITTDHGRARDFREHERASEAGAIWLVAAGHRVRERGVIQARSRELADLAPTIAELLEVPLEGAQGAVLSELWSHSPARGSRIAGQVRR